MAQVFTFAWVVLWTMEQVRMLHHNYPWTSWASSRRVINQRTLGEPDKLKYPIFISLSNLSEYCLNDLGQRIILTFVIFFKCNFVLFCPLRTYWIGINW